MIDRGKLPELIDRFNNGELSGEEFDDFQELLKANPRLRNEVRLDKELNEILADSDLLEFRKTILSVQKKRLKGKGPGLQSYLLAASLLLFIGIEIFLFMNNSRQNMLNRSGAVTNNQPAIKEVIKGNITENEQINSKSQDERMDKISPKAKQAIAASFKTNPSFENIIGTTRNAGAFKMEFPKMGARLIENRAIVFRWSMHNKANNILKIIDNSGSEVYTSGLIEEKSYILSPGILKKGLYYYKIIEKDEIVFFGKFYVE
ncbi:MAG: hypothetical protein ABSD71_12145 [Bacteroidales bacterium]|jgi:hypothetical protein